MKPSEFDGRTVVYIDHLRVQYSGVVVGQSADGQWLFIQSDQQGVTPAEWHFKLHREIVEGLVTPA